MNYFKTISQVILLSLLVFPAAQAATTTTYFVNDALGSPVAAMDETGALKWRKQYKPYGENLEPDSQASTNKVGYTGHVEDSSTGLTYMGARYYDPGVGRFMGVDSAPVNADAPMSFNRYAYGNNNPYRYIDPDGRNPVLALERSFMVGFRIGTRIESAIESALGNNLGALIYLAVHSESADDGDFSEIEDLTEPGSIPNIGTDVTKGEFEDNLVDSGFDQSTSKDGKVKIFTKGDKKFTTRDTSKSTGGPSADVFKGGDKKSKIRLGN